MASPTRRTILQAAPLVASVSAVPALAKPGQTDALQLAIKRHRDAWEAFSLASDRTDTVAVRAKSGTITAQDEADYDAAAHEETQSFSDLVDVPCATLADHGRKAAYLLTTCTVADGFMDEDDVRALLQSIVGSGA